MKRCLACLLIVFLTSWYGTSNALITGKSSAGGSVALRALLEGDETNGDPLAYGSGTVTKTNAANITFVEASQGVGFDIDGNTDDIVSVDVANINPDKFRVIFKFKKTDQVRDNFGKFLCIGNEQVQFMTTNSGLDYRVDYNGVIVFTNATTLVNIYDGSSHTMEVNISNATDTVSVYVDGSAIANETSGVTWPANVVSPGILYFGNRSDGLRAAGGIMADITVYNTLRGE